MRCCGVVFFILFLGWGASVWMKCNAQDSPGFFLKINKNIPRLGRRSDRNFESLFWPNFKNLQADENNFNKANYLNNNLKEWLSKDMSKLRTKRALYQSNSITAADRALNLVQPVNSNTLIQLLDTNAISNANVKFIHWKDFDLALQFDDELYAKVVSLGRKPDQQLKRELILPQYNPLFGNDLQQFDNNLRGYSNGHPLNLQAVKDNQDYKMNLMNLGQSNNI